MRPISLASPRKLSPTTLAAIGTQPLPADAVTPELSPIESQAGRDDQILIWYVSLPNFDSRLEVFVSPVVIDVF